MRELQGVNKEHDNFIYEIVSKMMTRIVDIQDRETMRVIEEYCKENNIIPNLIDKNKLDLVLRLGIQALNLRELKVKDLYKKDFNGDKIFCLEYDKETLRDMVLDNQQEIERLNNIIKKGTIIKVREILDKENQDDKD